MIPYEKLQIFTKVLQTIIKKENTVLARFY